MPATTQPRAEDGRPDPPRVSTRWHALDVLKGLALWLIIAHHFNKWAGGNIDERFVGFDHFVVTDLAAPMFALALGAGAVMVGSRITAWAGLRAPLWRWGQILLVGLAIDLVTHRGIEGRGVLPTLALVGAAVTVAVAAGLRNPWAWWAISAACVVVAVPATAPGDDSVLALLLSGPFALPVYGVFGAAGAAVAAQGLGQPERSLPLVRAAAGVLVVGLVASALGRGVVAPEGIWPPARYPGHLGFTLWGLVGSLVAWAALRAVLPAGGRLSDAMARAGRRTLFVFAAHFAVKVVMQQAQLIGDLDTRRWGYAVWAAVAAVCALTTVPVRRHQSG